jgi:hypothetical protein
MNLEQLSTMTETVQAKANEHLEQLDVPMVVSSMPCTIVLAVIACVGEPGNARALRTNAHVHHVRSIVKFFPSKTTT